MNITPLTSKGLGVSDAELDYVFSPAIFTSTMSDRAAGQQSFNRTVAKLKQEVVSRMEDAPEVLLDDSLKKLDSYTQQNSLLVNKTRTHTDMYY